MTEEKTWRQVNVEKATAARVRRKHERWAVELRAAGWRITEPADPIEHGERG